ncbi:MAG: dephospho-CoA kinase [Phycisphaerae bacterium]
MKPGKPIIGLTGGIGSGKSTVARLLGDLGAGVIDADRLCHEDLDSPEVLRQMRQWWGDDVVGPDGRADRSAIRRIVGADEGQRRRLEDLVHPRVDRRRRELAEQYQMDPSVRAIVLDAPLLLEVGLDRECDCLIFVDADGAARLDRVGKRGWSLQDLERFERSQLPLDIKRERADYRVVNNSDIADLRRQVEEVFSRILAG